MTDRLVVYTMAIGGVYELQPPPVCDGVDFFCFSDQDILETNGWELVKVNLIIPSDKFRSSRDFKVRPHRWLGNYSRSIYVDSNVHLLQDPELLWDYIIPSESTVFGGFFHSYRETVSDEFTAVRDARLDYQSTLDFHKSVYRNHHVEVLHSKVVWGGLLARRHNDASCINAMETWYANILRFSRRDQLSLPLALSHLSCEQTTIVSNDNFETKFHRWPAGRNAKPAGYQVDERMSPFKRMRISMSKKSRKFWKYLRK